MRNMSFNLTEQQFLDGSKTVTRRLGWEFLRSNDRLRAVRKSRGLKRGEHPVVLGVIRVKRVDREQLRNISWVDVIAEGFPRLTTAEFMALFCKHMKCQPDVMVTRIEFEKVEVPQ